MPSSMFVKPLDRIQRSRFVVMQQTSLDDVAHIHQLWPAVESLVGLRGRKMYGYVDLERSPYAACTPVRDGDDPEELGSRLGTLPGRTSPRLLPAGRCSFAGEIRACAQHSPRS